jgi:hypothetical protein
MTQIEFNQTIDLINDSKKQAQKVKEELSSKIKELAPEIELLLNVFSKKNKNFDMYLNSIKEFNFSERTMVDSNLFPGIKTVSTSINPEELQQKADLMRDTADQINITKIQCENHKNIAVRDIKKVLSLLIEYIKFEDQIHDMESDVLNKLDSPYDIGQLATNN